jgi:hypothetical protein
MHVLIEFPQLLFVISFGALLLSAEAGVRLRNRIPLFANNERDDFFVVLTATLTLLGLIIGFTFTMAISRYDLRKHYEEEEANAIGTEYVRAGLVTSENAVKLQAMLKAYLAQRILFYTTRNASHLTQINANTAQLQQQMWAVVQESATENPSATKVLVVSGMNDVLNAQSYTQAAWWNRIPIAAWALMFSIAFTSNFLVGYGMQRNRWGLLMVLPLVIAISFFLIADIDSPRQGVIQVVPDDLIHLAAGAGIAMNDPASLNFSR